MEFSFRLLTEDDFPLLMVWLHKPHVVKWWREPPQTLNELTAKYAGRILGNDPTDVYFAQLDGKAIGLIQSYWVADYPEHAETIPYAKAVGIDLFIGEELFIGRGYGPTMLTQFMQQVVGANYENAKYVVSDPETANVASVRAFEKAGFTKDAITPGEYGPEQLMVYEL